MLKEDSCHIGHQGPTGDVVNSWRDCDYEFKRKITIQMINFNVKLSSYVREIILLKFASHFTPIIGIKLMNYVKTISRMKWIMCI